MSKKQIKIKELLNKWEKELRSDLKNKKYNIEIQVSLIPKEWKMKYNIPLDENLKNDLKNFNRKISKDGGKSVFPNSEFSVIKAIKEINEGIIVKKARYLANKLVVDLGLNNYYFYYINKQDNICEGYLQSLNNKINNSFVNSFTENSIEGFFSLFLSNKKYKIEKNKMIFNLTNVEFVLYNNQDLINSLKKPKINNYINNNFSQTNSLGNRAKRENKNYEHFYQLRSLDNKHKMDNNSYRQQSKIIKNNANNVYKIKSSSDNRNKKINTISEQQSKNIKNKNENYKNENNKNNDENKEITKCLINYHFSNIELDELKKEQIQKGENKKKFEKQNQFIPVNKDWIKSFIKICNYNTNKNNIEKFDIDNNNVTKKLEFNNMVNDKIPIYATKEINVKFMNKEYNIYEDYELINSKAYNILSNYFGKENKNYINKLNVSKLDNNYILVKYDNKKFEIIKIKNEKERYLIIGKNNIDKNIIKELSEFGFDEWARNKKMNLKIPSNDIYENEILLGRLIYLKEIKKYEDKINKKEDKKINEEIRKNYFSVDNKYKNNFYNKRNIYKNKEKGSKENKDEKQKEKLVNPFLSKEEIKNEKKEDIRILKRKIKRDKDKLDLKSNYTIIPKRKDNKEKFKKNKFNTEENEKEKKEPIYENIEEGNNKRQYNDESLSYNQENQKYIKKGKKINGLIGLQNVGATCYMNAALQCLSNIPKLRKYFLTNKSKIYNVGINKLSSALLTIFENLWENKLIDYFIPQEFKNIISKMNPLFEGIQANDTKDLLLFILETIHNELNENKIKTPENEFYNPTNYNLVFNNFCQYFKNNFNSIISDLFYGMNNSMMTCCSCKSTTHNIQCFNILFFPLEEVRKFKGYQQNMVDLYDCFEYNQKQEFMMGDNQISCNQCYRMSNAIIQSKIIISPNILVINFNRGKGLIYDIKVNFQEYLEIKNFVYYQQSPHYYELIGVVTHLGGSDMSGHFIAFCKNSENQKWYKFNDAYVIESSFQEVVSFGVPYVLFYNYIKC